MLKYMLKQQSFVKTVSWLTLVLFVSSFITHPLVFAVTTLSPANQDSQQLSGKGNQSLIPYRYGKITGGGYAGGRRLVVYIQDLHCNPEVQNNIAKITELLDAQYGLNKIFIEGAPAGKLSTRLFTSIPDEKVRDKTIQTLFGKGLLSGAEYYALKLKKDNLYGLEEWSTYTENRERYRTVSAAKEENEKTSAEIDKVIEQMKEKYLDRKLKTIGKVFRDSGSNKHYLKVAKLGERAGEKVTGYPNLARYIETVRISESISNRRLNKELVAYIKDLKRIVPAREFLPLSVALTETGDRQEYSRRLSEIAKVYSPDLAREYPEVNRFLTRERLNAQINPVDLIDEEIVFQGRLTAKFAERRLDKDLLFLSRMAKNLGDFAALKMTPGQYQFFSENREEFRIVLRKYCEPHEVKAVLKILDDAAYTTYYAVNFKRNDIFINAIALRSLGEKIGGFASGKKDVSGSLSAGGYEDVLAHIGQFKDIDIVVAGGFHRGVSKLLHDKGVSYLTITPGAAKKYDGTVYQQVMTGKIDLKKMLSSALAPTAALLGNDYGEMEILIAHLLANAESFHAAVAIIKQWQAANTDVAEVLHSFDVRMEENGNAGVYQKVGNDPAKYSFVFGLQHADNNGVAVILPPSHTVLASPVTPGKPLSAGIAAQAEELSPQKHAVINDYIAEAIGAGRVEIITEKTHSGFKAASVLETTKYNDVLALARRYIDETVLPDGLGTIIPIEVLEQANIYLIDSVRGRAPPFNFEHAGADKNAIYVRKSFFQDSSPADIAKILIHASVELAAKQHANQQQKPWTEAVALQAHAVAEKAVADFSPVVALSEARQLTVDENGFTPLHSRDPGESVFDITIGGVDATVYFGRSAENYVATPRSFFPFEASIIVPYGSSVRIDNLYSLNAEGAIYIPAGATAIFDEVKGPLIVVTIKKIPPWYRRFSPENFPDVWKDTKGYDESGLRYHSTSGVLVFSHLGRRNPWNTSKLTEWLIDSVSLGSPAMGASTVSYSFLTTGQSFDIHRPDEQWHEHPTIAGAQSIVEIYIPTSGIMELLIESNGKFYSSRLRPGMFMLVQADVRHAIAKGSGQYKHVVIQIPSPFQYGFLYSSKIMPVPALYAMHPGLSASLEKAKEDGVSILTGQTPVSAGWHSRHYLSNPTLGSEPAKENISLELPGELLGLSPKQLKKIFFSLGSYQFTDQEKTLLTAPPGLEGFYRGLKRVQALYPSIVRNHVERAWIQDYLRSMVADFPPGALRRNFEAILTGDFSVDRFMAYMESFQSYRFRIIELIRDGDAANDDEINQMVLLVSDGGDPEMAEHRRPMTESAAYFHHASFDGGLALAPGAAAKYAHDGSPKPFPGYTVIHSFRQGADHHRALLKMYTALQARLREAKVDQYFKFLPPKTFHMTLCDIMAPLDKNTPEGSALGKKITAIVTKIFSDFASSIKRPVMYSKGVAISAGTSIVVPVYMGGRDDLAEVLKLRTALRDGLHTLGERGGDGVFRNNGIPVAPGDKLIGHVTLAYLKESIPAEAYKKIQNILGAFEREFIGFSEADSFDLHYFENMEDYGAPLESLHIASPDRANNLLSVPYMLYNRIFGLNTTAGSPPAVPAGVNEAGLAAPADPGGQEAVRLMLSAS